MTRLGAIDGRALRRLVAAIAVVALAATLTAGGTFAYFTTNSVSASVITAGKVGLSLTEYQRSATGQLEPFTQGQRVVPATTVSLEPVVKNVENQPVWVRMQASIAVIAPDGSEQTVEAVPAASTSAGNTSENVVELVFDTAHWTYADGYWYYGWALQPGEEAAALFSQVKFSPVMGNEYQGATFRVDVSAQGVQTLHTGESALEATGWPEDK